jgi:flavodoxin
MKSLVVYYSLEGNTEYTAKIIAEKLGSDRLELVPQKDYPKGGLKKYIWGGKAVVLGNKPKLNDYNVNIEEYDLIILGTPVWASNFAPPIKTFISENSLKGKTVAFFACHGGGEALKCFEKLREETGALVLSTLSLKDPSFEKNEYNIGKIEEFCKKLK